MHTSPTAGFSYLLISYMQIYPIIIVYGNIRISGGGTVGKLEFQNVSGEWGAVCITGFDADAGAVTCTQLGYEECSGVYTYD